MPRKFEAPKDRPLLSLRKRHSVTITLTVATSAQDGSDVVAHELANAVRRNAVDVHGVGIRVDSVTVNGDDIYSKGPAKARRRG